jgi:hypothetical protein
MNGANIQVMINDEVDRTCEPMSFSEFIVKGDNIIDLLTLVTGLVYAVALIRSYWVSFVLYRKAKAVHSVSDFACFYVDGL